jgi:signal transduction histidine kinase
MLGDLIDMAHLESGYLTLDRKPVDLALFADELKTRLEGTLPIERVTWAVPAGLPAASVDARRFERILVNLLSNALKYAPAPAPVVLGAAVQGDEVVVSVADGGPGISQEDLPNLFEKYFRASATRAKEGLGIGLYGTRLLVHAHGGRIWVGSALGKGTTFYVALPTAQSEDRQDVASGSLGVRAEASA